ncbi:MAG TPA: DUF6597 domain-containing transcriptional factor [Terracidiphilus sp.]|nr:DUF6597 domain-containing transcriptional factor [Terracidiphilus sp.]
MNGVISQFAGAYREWLPDPALRDHIRCLWVNDLTQSPAGTMQVVPDGCVDIVWNGRGLCVAGPDTRPIHEPMPHSFAFAGIRFHPGAACSWLGLPLSEIVNARVPLCEFWNSEAARIADEASLAGSAFQIAGALQSALLLRLSGAGTADRQIRFLRRAAGDNCAPARIGVAGIAAYVGISERTLRRRCMEAFGYGFKTLDRVFRFQRFFRLASGSANTLAALAAGAGYADQAHLTREVQRMSGLTPGEFVSQIAA